MEKFGIFELLDALSAVVLDGEEKQSPQRNDRVYDPPVYASAQTEENLFGNITELWQKNNSEQNETPPKKAGSYAIDEFYRQHDSRAKK